MKMLNKISKSESPRADIIAKLRVINADLNRLYEDLEKAGGRKGEMEPVAEAYSILRFAALKIDPGLDVVHYVENDEGELVNA